MNSYIRVNDIWKEVKSLYIKQNNIWKEVKEQYIKVDNIWKQSYQSCLNIAEHPVGTQGIWCGHTEWGILTKATGTTNGMLVNPSTDGFSTWHNAMSICPNIGNDWFLPNRQQLAELCNNYTIIGGFNWGTAYWTSVSFNSSEAWCRRFSDCAERTSPKTISHYAFRCARSY